MSDKKLVVVTGGAGFIGSHLCRRLVEEGYRVISLDNYFTGSKDNHVPGVEYREGHTKNISEMIPEHLDIIYHLGEYARVAKSLEEPALVWDLNVEGTLAVLEFWRAHKCKLVYSGSSTKAVGARADGVVGRDLAPYTWAKAAMSDLVNNYARWYGLSYAIVYFYNVYGPGERALDGYGTVIESFHQKYLKREPLQVRSPGTQRRAFTHVEDTINGILLAGQQGEGDGYGISSTDDYSLLEVAHMFGGEMTMLPATSTTREQSVIDSEKISVFGWKQTKTLAEYIQAIIKK
ncbi:NAD-dependent epimerase/dehydratase family protein [Candidatus Uhrbacteria bacterium]|nr:NAD-dependent epimerase/dehydratase family protein [Candidatus Uhrbacteria bacterium]